ncbi:phage holin family protein [Aquirufa sp. ROCK2-A2]
MGIFDNSGILNLLTNYLKTQFEIIKIDIQDKIEELLIRIFNYFLAALSIGITFLFVLMGLAAWLNDYLQSTFLGFFIVAGIAFVASVLLLLTIKKSTKHIEETSENEELNTKEDFSEHLKDE